MIAANGNLIVAVAVLGEPTAVHNISWTGHGSLDAASTSIAREDCPLDHFICDARCGVAAENDDGKPPCLSQYEIQFICFIWFFLKKIVLNVYFIQNRMYGLSL